MPPPPSNSPGSRLLLSLLAACVCTVLLVLRSPSSPSSSSMSPLRRMEELHSPISSSSSAEVQRRGLVAENNVEGLNVDLAIEETQKTLSLMYNRYELSTKLGEVFVLIQQNIIESDWNLIKYRFGEKILSEGEDSRFLMIFGGSSVTAGHDNGINVSFPLIVDKRMHAPLAAAGIDLQVHSIAQGANNCLPSNLCYESMGGHDPDFVAWEQSFNCGRDEKIFELPTRFAAWSKTPGSVYFSNSGSSNPTGCNNSEFKKPWSDEDWTPDLEGLPEWKPTASDVTYWKERNNFAHTKSGSTSQRFGSRSYAYRRYGVAVLGSDLWNNYKPADMCDKAPEMAGLSCTPEIFYSKCLLKMMRKEAAAYGMGRGARHHPGKGLHQVRGELIAFLYSLIFLDALYDVKDRVNTALGSSAGASLGAVSKDMAKSIKEMVSADRAKLVTLDTMPKPVVCAGYYCETKPKCFTDYRSHFSKDLFLSDQIVGKMNWTTNVPMPAVADKIFHEFRPGFYSSKESDGGIHFKIKIGATKFVIACFYHFPNANLANEYYLELNVSPDRLNADYIPAKDKVLNWETDVNVEWGVCQKIHNLPEGQHVLGIRFKENDKKAAAGITHLITWD